MKKISIAVALVSMIAIASCGGSSSTGGGGGGGTAQQTINSAVSAFGGLVEATFALAEGGNCPAKAVWDCSAACSNSGATLDLDDAGIATLASCQASGLTFSGTLTGSETSFTLNMGTFGGCTGVTGTVTDNGGCSGTVTGNCAGESITCAMDTSCETCTITSTGGGGGGGGGTTAQLAIDNSGEEFVALLDFMDGGCSAFPCNCPQAGTVNFVSSSLFLTSCQINGLTFTGEMSTDNNSTTMNFPTFGECESVTGTITGDLEGTSGCSGQLMGLCVNQSITCNFNSDCSGCTI